jgi:hypothetical protein
MYDGLVASPFSMSLISKISPIIFFCHIMSYIMSPLFPRNDVLKENKLAVKKSLDLVV